MKYLNKFWLIVITLLVFLLLNFPLIKIIDAKLVFEYIPLSYLYFYSIWLLLVFALRFIIIKITK